MAESPAPGRVLSRGRRATTGQRYIGAYQADRKLGEHDYLFGALRYERDRFSNFSYQTSVTAGYGRRLIDVEHVQVNGEVGAGMRQARIRSSGDTDREPVGRLPATFAGTSARPRG